MTDVVGAAKERFQRALHGRAEPEAACVTLVAGSTVGQVLDAFGADPGAPAVGRSEVPFGIPAVVVAETPGGVVAIEDNGFQGALRVLHEAANPDPFTAAGQALQNAHRTLRGADAGAFLAAALREARG